MIMRRGEGAVSAQDAERYLKHQAGTGVRDYGETSGKAGVLAPLRGVGDLVEVTTVSFWTSMDAAIGFAGEDPERATFYPGDDELLIEKDLPVNHYASPDIDVTALSQVNN